MLPFCDFEVSVWSIQKSSIQKILIHTNWIIITTTWCFVILIQTQSRNDMTRFTRWSTFYCLWGIQFLGKILHQIAGIIKSRFLVIRIRRKILSLLYQNQIITKCIPPNLTANLPIINGYLIIDYSFYHQPKNWPGIFSRIWIPSKQKNTISKKDHHVR